MKEKGSSKSKESKVKGKKRGDSFHFIADGIPYSPRLYTETTTIASPSFLSIRVYISICQVSTYIPEGKISFSGFV